MVGSARFAGIDFADIVESVDLKRHPDRLQNGTWFVVATFEGTITGWRFRHTTPSIPSDNAPHKWRGPAPGAWASSMDKKSYCAAVETVRAHVVEGEVYQANVCRILSAPMPAEPDAEALAALLSAGNPAPYQGYIQVPAGHGSDPIWVVTASPELYLRVRGARISSSPIKGTARTPDGLSDKDRAENIMITDLVRNDLQRICEPGTITVDPLLATEDHPGLTHLVSTVHGALATREWARILAETFPPGSISGAPKEAALAIIAKLETAPRGPYCGAIGVIDADRDEATLAVGIRTFWWEQPGVMRFGTGAGITFESDAEAEWAETELKAARLIALASGGTVA
ncbi:chorismate-binding protein [Rarobacter incanus]|uniref:Para-aminobenzoate synthetase component 1 n=1 Tax=Rarobacter incanus TaxID=153494 RepID=A0A542SMF7_9MICO|nr:chorismate-binding protein [Rarobacter incanus]TQK75816.1 para-aminobenzoate synthetase component 1 [Rarobacter incanus]